MVVIAGTLTANEMAVVRMWLADQEFTNLQFLSGRGVLEGSIDGKVGEGPLLDGHKCCLRQGG